ARQGEDELVIEERLAAGEAERRDALGEGVFEEADGGGDVEAIGPLDRHAAMRAGQVALVRSGEGEVVGPERARAPPHRPDVGAATGYRSWNRPRHATGPARES